MDTIDPKTRSAVMSKIRSKDTAPELLVRRLTHAMGFRYRLHVKNLPGKPDLVFASRSAVIFVHGCFWHLHENCREGRTPASNKTYWDPKLQRNVQRDRANIRALKRDGWRVLVLWECQLKDSANLQRKIRRFLDHHRN